MIVIENFSNDPAYNLALEEFLLLYRRPNRDVFFLWQNEPTVVIGRHQNTFDEIIASISKRTPWFVTMILTVGLARAKRWAVNAGLVLSVLPTLFAVWLLLSSFSFRLSIFAILISLIYNVMFIRAKPVLSQNISTPTNEPGVENEFD